MIKEFKEYITESIKEYKYTLKLAVDNVDDTTLDCLENCLSKYQLISASPFKKTPIQESPLDFPNVKCSPVYISEIVMSYPASRDFLETYIASSMAISEQSVVVYSSNDPRGIETDLYLERSADTFKEEYEARLGKEDYIGEEPTDAESHEDARMSLLKELEQLRKERSYDIVENPLSYGETIEHDDIGTDYDSFNDGLPAEDVGLFGRINEAGVKNSFLAPKGAKNG